MTCCKNIVFTERYECSELSECEYGFYSRKDEQVAKATALFVKKYGLVKYDKTLENAIQTGVKYPEQINHLSSVQEMFQLLESYLYHENSVLNKKHAT